MVVALNMRPQHVPSFIEVGGEASEYEMANTRCALNCAHMFRQMYYAWTAWMVDARVGPNENGGPD